MGHTWERNHTSSGTINSLVQVRIARVPVGQTINRTIFGYSVAIVVNSWNWELLIGRPVFVGVQTIGSGNVGSLQSPSAAIVTEVAPPTQRWLYWEATELVSQQPPSWDTHNRLAMLTVAAQGTPRESHGQVLNNLAGQTLDVYIGLSCPALAVLGIEFTARTWGAVLYQT